MDNNITPKSHCTAVQNQVNFPAKNVNDCVLKHVRGGGADTNHNSNSLTHFVFSYIFLFLLSTPLIFSLAGQDVFLDVVGENRNLAKAPDFRTTPLGNLPKEWDKYFKDRTPFRQVFMPGYLFVYENLLKTFMGGFATGRGRELFCNFHDAPVLEAALGLRPLESDLLEHLRLTAAGEQAYFRSRDIPFYLFLAPDKGTLYPELLPFYADWIPHRTWHDEQTAALEKAHINFYPLNGFLRSKKDQGRLYDVVFDNGHWNGLALALSYQYIAGLLSRDNPIFRPVPYGEYYDVVDTPVTFQVYGSETTGIISLKHTEDFSCTELPEEYRSAGYNRLCTNSKVQKGVLWFFSDSYFGATHGSGAMTPFIHNVHTYIHRHYVIGKTFTDLADETMRLGRPDAVIEEFVERMGGILHSKWDPRLRLLGDFWMKTNGIFLENGTDLSAFELKDIDRSAPAPDELIMKSGSRLSLKSPAAADDLGRVAVMGRISTPAGAKFRISWRDESGAAGAQDFSVAKGTQIFHETVHVRPFSKVSLSLQFLTPGKYTLEKIQEIDDLRERM